jgi:hypothetical protein
MPVSQGELVRDMMDWFAGQEDFPPPDERTVRRKVSAIWGSLLHLAPDRAAHFFGSAGGVIWSEQPRASRI